MKCLSILPESKVIITENLDMYEVMSVGDRGNLYYLEKLPAKATIDFMKYYGDGRDNGKANWTCDHTPWYERKDGT